jgi:hypothetical protein
MRGLGTFELDSMLDCGDLATLGLRFAINLGLRGAAIGLFMIADRLCEAFGIAERWWRGSFWSVTTWHRPPLCSEQPGFSTLPVKSRSAEYEHDDHDQQNETEQAATDVDTRCNQHVQ